MINLDLFFRYLKGRCHGNQCCKNGKLPSFVALAFQNGMEYRYINVRINSVNDAYISCKNFVNFGRITLELTELICELLVRHGKKLAYLVECFRIYFTNFRNLSPYESALDADDRSARRFSICQETLPWQPNYVGRK